MSSPDCGTQRPLLGTNYRRLFHYGSRARYSATPAAASSRLDASSDVRPQNGRPDAVSVQHVSLLLNLMDNFRAAHAETLFTEHLERFCSVSGVIIPLRLFYVRQRGVKAPFAFGANRTP